MKIKLIQNKMPNIYIANNAMNKIEQYVKESAKEIGWLGTVVKQDNSYIIEDVFLFKQEVHATTTEITPEGLNEFAMELMSSDEGMEIWNNMKLWGHSHVNMGVNPSGQDDKQVETFESCGYDFFIRMITNKRGEMRLDLYNYENGVIYSEMDYSILYTEDENRVLDSIDEQIKKLKQLRNDCISMTNQEIEAIKAEIKEKVTTKTYVTTGVAGAGYPRYNGYGTHSGLATSSPYGNWWDDYTTYDDDKDVKKNTSVVSATKSVSNVDDYFDTMSVSDIFETFICIEQGHPIDTIVDAKLTKEEYEDLEDYICGYVIDNNHMYATYLEDLEEEYKNVK